MDGSPRGSPTVHTSSKPSSSSSHPLTVKSVLASHSTAANPSLAALDQIVAERNTLSSQNSQLWKLVEKQRSGYSQILKELERVRAERDIYRARLETIGDDPDQVLQTMKRQRRHRSKAPSKSSSGPRTEEQASLSDPKFTMIKTDDPKQEEESLAPIVGPQRGASLQNVAPPPTLRLGGNASTPLSSAPLSSSGISSGQSFVTNSSAPSPLAVPPRSQARSSSLPRQISSQDQDTHRSESTSSTTHNSGYTNGGESSSQLAYSTEGTDNGEFLDLGSETGDDESIRSASTMSDREPDQDLDSGPGSAGEPLIPRQSDSVEEFPMPPASNQTTISAHSRGISGGTLEQTQSLNSQASSTLYTTQSRSAPDIGPQVQFRALPLLAADLPHTKIQVSHSSIRPNDRGKEVLSFVIVVNPGNGKDSWQIEKLYSDVIALDQRVKGLSRSLARKMPMLPDSKLWRDHAPAKVDQRKVALEQYCQTIIALPFKDRNDIIAFFTSDIVRARQPVSSAGYKEGYLTKRGKNFGGWKRRYFVLQGSVLEYYESRGGAHLGSITITGAQIGRQQRSGAPQPGDEENEYRHAFLIIEGKKNPSMASNRHVLCAESDKERDAWVEVLVKHVTGNYQDDQQSSSSGMYNSAHGLTPIHTGGTSSNGGTSSLDSAAPRSSTSSLAIPETTPRKPTRAMSKDEISRGPAIPISQLAPDPTNAKLFVRSPDEILSPVEKTPVPGGPNQSLSDIPLSSSLPISSPLEGDHGALASINPRSNSELGQYPDLAPTVTATRQAHPAPTGGGASAEFARRAERQNRRSSVQPLKLSPSANKGGSADLSTRAPSPDPHTPRVDMNGKVKISGPMNGAPLPAGYKFGSGVAGKEPEPPAQTGLGLGLMPTPGDRREKAKSRMFWGFGRPSADKPAASSIIPRAVFGISIEESLEVAQIANLPAVVFRCIQYLETKKAELEEGIYRLSGSSAVIKSLKDRFNLEGDVDLLASDEYWDPHAIAGLLKSFMRELPGSLLTRELHTSFLSVIDFVDAQERIKELSNLISRLPLANYSLLRALTAHLILIVQNSNTNKMTMRNVGIVFSPTLGIPAGVFSLMLGEFNRVFNVDDKGVADYDDPEERRNSRHYTDAAADELLGLSGRYLPAPPADDSDDGGDDLSMQDDSELEPVEAPGSTEASGSSAAHAKSRMSMIAANRGLGLAVTNGGSSHPSSGLPNSPRPMPSPRPTPSPSANSPMRQ